MISVADHELAALWPQIKGGRMDYKIWIATWAILAISIVYWDMHRWESKEPISVCHNAEIKIYHDRPMCTECKLFCEVVNEKR